MHFRFKVGDLVIFKEVPLRTLTSSYSNWSNIKRRWREKNGPGIVIGPANFDVTCTDPYALPPSSDLIGLNNAHNWHFDDWILVRWSRISKIIPVHPGMLESLV